MVVAAVNSTESAPEDVIGRESAGTAIELCDVTVAYRSYKERPTSLKESVLRFLKSRKLKYFSTFDALRNISFSVKRGEIFAIIGSNGAGKSTLLKVLTKVLKPTHGTVTINGTVASLIELGVGFDMELNAIENIYLNASLHQKGRDEIKERVPGIIDFAELQEFASTPIKYYSSGMSARLGFACAIDINPDVLLIDEVLSVGDERFQKKCKAVFEGFLKSGKTLVIVTHDLNFARQTAHRVGLLSRGQLVYVGDPETAIAMYRDSHYQTVLGH